jgi:hypothetical protein
MSTRFPLIVRQTTVSYARRSLLPVGEVARLAGIDPDFVARLMDLGLLDPVETTPEPFFTVSAVLRIRRIMRIHHDLGVNWAGMGVVMDLLAKIDDLEHEVARLRHELSKERG